MLHVSATVFICASLSGGQTAWGEVVTIRPLCSEAHVHHLMYSSSAGSCLVAAPLSWAALGRYWCSALTWRPLLAHWAGATQVGAFPFLVKGNKLWCLHVENK